MKKIVISVLVAFVVIFSVLVVYRVNERNKRQEELKKVKPLVTAVSVIFPKTGSISEDFSTNGVIVSSQSVEIIPKVSGKLLYLSAKDGDYVSKGKILGEIEHNEIDMQLLQAKAQVDAANANLELLKNGPLKEQIAQSESFVKQSESSFSQIKLNLEHAQDEFLRMEKLFNDKVVTEQQYKSAKTTYESLKKQSDVLNQQIVSAYEALKIIKKGSREEHVKAGKANLKQAEGFLKYIEAQIENYKLVSPLNGIITKKNMDPGNIVTPYTSIFSISKFEEPEVEMSIPEKYAFKLKEGQSVLVVSENFKGEMKIKTISPVIDPLTHLLKIKAEISHLPENFKLGMSFNCRIILNEQAKALLVPSDTVIESGGKKLVYIVDKNNKVEEKEIKAGLQTLDEIQILSGLDKSEKVIMSGNTFVKPGDLVEIENDSFGKTNE